LLSHGGNIRAVVFINTRTVELAGNAGLLNVTALCSTRHKPSNQREIGRQLCRAQEGDVIIINTGKKCHIFSNPNVL